MPRTRHEHVLLWVTEGGLHLQFPRRRHDLLAGCLRFVPAGTAFTAHTQTGLRGHVLLVAPSLLREVEPGFPTHDHDLAVGTAGPEMLALMMGMDVAGPSAAPEAGVRHRLCELARCLSRLTRPTLSEHAAQETPEPALIDRFLTLAALRMCDNRTVAELAGQLDTSCAVLEQACLATRGKRAIELIHDLRLSRALELLRGGGQSPAQIARDLGYSGHAHLTRACVAATGRIPESFRLQP